MLQEEKQQFNDPWITVEEAAKLVRISTRRMWEFLYASHDAVPYYRVGKKMIRVKVSELEEWMKRRRCGGE